MVLLTMTPAMVKALQAYNANPPSLTEDLTLSSEPSLDNVTECDPISHSQILGITRHLREQAALGQELDFESEVRPSYHLDDLLRGARVFIPPARPEAEPVEHRDFEHMKRIC